MVREYKGAYSGEHGDGLVRSEWVAWQFGPRLTRAFEEVKALFDPQGLMNPGKIVRPPRMDDATLFRFPPGYATMPVATTLDWAAWDVARDDPSQGFAKAVEMCNNNGHCRKFDAGTMCPSFRATRDEQHLTRGRANTLRLALSGHYGADLASPEVRDALELCVSCKGCRRDCPTGVDMARMKIEFRHHWQRRHGLTRRERMFATLPRWAARSRALTGLREAIPGARWIGEKLLGVSAKRALPRAARTSFLATPGLRDDDDADVVLLVDTFGNHFEPENAHAALAVLRAAGRRVAIARAAGDARPLCCGRTLMTAGLVDEARHEAKRVVNALAPHVARGAAVVGLEPSCLLSLRDEFLALGLGEGAASLSARAMLVPEFLVREREAGRLSLPLKALPQRRALVHGHCHQKAFDAFAPTLAMLRWIPDLTVEAVESSCCGMAGSFGYEAEHHEVSMRMGELALLPAVRAAAADTLVVADGTSCRHQIADGAGRTAVHAIRVLADALSPAA